MKNNSTLFLASALLLSYVAKSQSPVTAYVKAGPAIAIGAYGAGMENEEAGLARSGMSYGAGVSYDLNRNFYRLSMEFQYRSNPTNESEMKDWAQKSYPGIDWNIHAGTWKMQGLMLGVGTYVPEEKKLVLGFKIGLGVFGFNSPDLSITGSAGETSAFVSTKSDNAISGAFSIETEAGYRFNAHHSLTFSPDYFLAKPEFKSTNPVDGSSMNYKQEISTIGLNFRYNCRF
ncbi:MAG: hypothetical protein ACKOKF_05410 [Bacteroidota bacterium]